MCSWDRDRVRGISRPSGSVGLCRMSCMAFRRPVLPEAMKSAYVASTSDIARASSTQQQLREEQPSLYLHLKRTPLQACVRLHQAVQRNLLLIILQTVCTTETDDITVKLIDRPCPHIAAYDITSHAYSLWHMLLKYWCIVTFLSFLTLCLRSALLLMNSHSCTVLSITC